MIVSHLLEVVVISALGLLLRWENKKRDRIQSQMEGGLEGRDLDATAFMDLTDRENLKYVFLSLASLECSSSTWQRKIKLMISRTASDISIRLDISDGY